MSARPATGPALLAVVGAASLFGLTGTIAELGPDDLPPVTAGVWRSIIGGAGLVLIAVVAGRAPWRYPLASRPAAGWVLVGGLGVAGYQLAFFEAVDRTGVALGTLITIAAGPPFAGLLDAVVQRRPPTRPWYVGSASAICGVAVLSAGSVDVDPVGVGLALVAGASFPTFGLAAQRLMRDRPFLPSMATVFAAGAVLLAPVAAVTAGDVIDDADAALTVVLLGLVTLTVAYSLWGIGLDRLALSVVVTVTLVEPAVASTLAVVVLDEPLTAALLIGLVLVAAGVWISARPAAEQRGSVADAADPDRGVNEAC